MFLLRIKDTNDFLGYTKKEITQLTLLKKQLSNKVQLLNLLKKTRQTKNLSLIIKKMQTPESMIKYIIGISLSNTNTNVYVSDIKGKVNFSVSAGSLGLTSKQETKKPAILIKLLRLAISKIKFTKQTPVALHLKNFTEFYASVILTLLKKYLTVEFVRVYNNKPHNGCRPKKLKRKKRRRIIFR